MRSAKIMTALCAALSIASPVLIKNALVTDIVTTYVYVYVTAGEVPAATHHTTHVHQTQAAAPKVITTAKPAVPVVKSTTPIVVLHKPTTTAKTAHAPAAAAEPASDSFENVVVAHHNLHRANNSAPAMTYDTRIAGYAATVAGSCHYAHDLTPGGGGYGQNIAVYGTTAHPETIGASTSIAQAITNMWYDGEVGLFPAADYGKPTPDMTNFEDWGHYSQVVWKSSTGVGCAAQFCAKGTIFADMGSWFSVCNYFPAGMQTQIDKSSGTRENFKDTNSDTGNMGGAYGTNVLPPLGKGTVTA